MNLLTGDIRQYLEISNEDTLVKTGSLDAVSADVIGDLHPKVTGLAITINTEPLGSIIGRADLIYILMHNLIDNAIKFRKDEVATVIRIQSNVNEMAAHADGEPGRTRFLRLSVQDNGLGIDPADSGQIFELFQKNHHIRKLRGSRVGLAVAKKIMNIHNGFITVESKPGEGSTFFCHFPTAPPLSGSAST